MNEIRPTKYASESNGSQFITESTSVAISYDVETNKRYGIIPQSRKAEIKINIDGDAETLSHSYTIPRNYLVKDGDFDDIGQGLYSLIDQIVRTVVQREKLDQLSDAKEEMYKDIKYHESKGLGAKTESPDMQSIYNDALNNTLLSIAYVTGITSLTAEGFANYQSGETKLLSDSVKPGLTRENLIENLAAYLESSGRNTNTRNAQSKGLNYLTSFNDSNAEISGNEAQMIIENFVPSYSQLMAKKKRVKGLPKNIVNHFIEGFIGGGIAGWLCLSVVGEAIVNNIFNTNYEIPGWYIGAAIQIVRPYLTVPFVKRTKDKQIEDQKKALVSSIRLSENSQGNQSLAEYVSGFSVRKEKNRGSRRRGHRRHR